MYIRPISDLRSRYAEIEETVLKGSPVYLTKNGYGVMVLVSLDAYEKMATQTETKTSDRSRGNRNE